MAVFAGAAEHLHRLADKEDFLGDPDGDIRWQHLTPQRKRRRRHRRHPGLLQLLQCQLTTIAYILSVTTLRTNTYMDYIFKYRTILIFTC
jgi:hypothetical protein